MSQTYGSQVFGPAYDVVVPVIMAVAFIYFGLRARGMTPDERKRSIRHTLTVGPKLCARSIKAAAV